MAAALKDEDEEVRARAAQALGSMEAKEYSKELAALLKDESPTVRGRAVQALGRMQAREYAKDVENLLKDPAQFYVSGREVRRHGPGMYIAVSSAAATALEQWGYKPRPAAP